MSSTFLFSSVGVVAIDPVQWVRLARSAVDSSPSPSDFNWNSDCAVVAAPATVAAEVAEGQRLFHSAADWNSHYFPNFQSLHKPELDQCLKRSRINNNATEISGLLSNNISSSRIN